MEPLLDATVFIVDDDRDVRDALAWLLRSRRLLSETYDSADAFEAMLRQRGLNRREDGAPEAPPPAGDGAPGAPAPPLLPARAFGQPCCLLLDMRMPGMSGLELFDLLAARGLHRTMPVIFLTGHADVATAVDTVKRGAFDFFEKPFSDNALVDRVERALGQSGEELAARSRSAGLQTRIAELTDRERDVMRLVVEGLPNKLIADQLGISVRTVEVHRSRVFEKMDVRSAVELANLLHVRT
jgi:two-component system response regulator DctR